MSAGEIIAIAAAGLAAGMINTVVGSGTLITFPVLLAFGYAPVTANVSNTVGLVPGSVSGAIGYRRELSGQRERAIRLGAASVLGGITGAVLLLVLPAAAFAAIVPVFIGLALVLIVAQPRLNRLLARHSDHSEHTGRSAAAHAVCDRRLRRLLRRRPGHPAAGHPRPCANAGSAPHKRSEERPRRPRERCSGRVLHLRRAREWAPAAIIAASSILGAQIGARYGRRLNPVALRTVIVVVGIAAIVHFVV